MRKLITLEHLQQCYPKETWTYIFTDGSAEDATCNGGAGVYVKYPDGTDDRLSFATGLYSTNYKAETEALRAAAAHIENSPHLSHRVVFFSDALSVLQALQTGKDTDLNNLMSNITRLCMKHAVIHAESMAMRPQILLQRKAQHMLKMTDPPHIPKLKRS